MNLKGGENQKGRVGTENTVGATSELGLHCKLGADMPPPAWQPHIHLRLMTVYRHKIAEPLLWDKSFEDEI